MIVQNLISIFNQRVSQTPNQLAYIFLRDGVNQEQKISYQELSQNSKSIAAKLQSSSPEGSRALLLYPQGLEFIGAFLGCLSAGVVAVPGSPPKRNQKMSRLAAIIKDAGPKVILTTSSILESIKDNLSDILDLSEVQWLATDNLNNSEELNWISPNINSDSLAFLQYTSGSTGRPKGVMISHDNILHNSACIQRAFELTEQSVSVTWLPSFHDMGLIDGIIQPLYTGFLGVVISPESFLQKPIVWLQAITKYRATHSGSPNLGYQLCIDKITPEQQKSLDLSSWESAYNGAEPVRQRTLEEFTAKFQSSGFQSKYFYPCYGMAEATLMISGGKISDEPVYFNAQAESLQNKIIVAADINSDNFRKIVGCGVGWLNTEIRIVDPQTYKQCADNQVGEIWVSSPSVAQGYWHQEEKTVETFQAKLVDAGQRNFLRTGDLGFLRNGELFITGRIKDLIIIWGRNHYPQDIEYSVQQSHKALRLDSGAAFTVEIENQEKLVIVQEVEREYLVKLDVDEVVSAIREAVSLNHDLQVYAILLIKPASIPKTSSGKIQRHLCRQNFLDLTFNSLVGEWKQSSIKTESLTENPHPVNRDNIINWLVIKLANVLGLEADELEMDVPFSHYGLDSSVALTLTGELGAWLNIDLEPVLFWEYTTINELTEYLLDRTINI